MDNSGAMPFPVRPQSGYLPRAVQWTGTNTDQVATLAPVIGHDDEDILIVQGYEGKCGLQRGDWVLSIPYDNRSGCAVLVLSDEAFWTRWSPAELERPA